jgi:4-alpha-glucanotransferase
VARTSGIVLHPTSLPGPYGIGDLGEHAYRFVDWLEQAGQSIWQVLPLGPTGYGDSPYQCFSAFAGNPLLISLDTLVKDELLDPKDLEDAPEFPAHRVDFGTVIQHRSALLERAAQHIDGHTQEAEFNAFCDAEAHWLEDYALFMAALRAQDYKTWPKWEKGLRTRKPAAMKKWRDKLADELHVIRFSQFQFFRQWHALRDYANEKGVRIMGDIPIYVAQESADVWSHPDLFLLDKDGSPTVVAGVPPDYFSATGQLWGNPIFDWNEMKKRGFAWWTDRMRNTLSLVDLVRIDHFRGFEAFWQVPADEETAVNGEWIEGPADALFDALRDALGEVPVVAENLGLITDEVEALRKRCGFPGMAVLQFAFGPDAKHSGLLPHKWTRDTVVYTGTPDNDTTVGWWKNTGKNTMDHAEFDRVRAYAMKYLDTDGADVPKMALRSVMSSVADTCIVPVQDVLGLGSDARMNTPGTMGGDNWTWRFTWDQLGDESAAFLYDLAETYGRLPEPSEEREPDR